MDKAAMPRVALQKNGILGIFTDVTQEITFCLNVIRYLKYPIFEQKTLAPYALRFLTKGAGRKA